MAWDATDWTITRLTGDIRYTGDDHGGGSPTYVTGIDFYRALQAFADDAASAGDDQLAITDLNPGSRATDNYFTLLNSYNIDDAASEHIYDASIVQNGGADIYDGIVNFGNAAVQIQIIQDGAVLADDWWNFSAAGLNADAAQGISHRFMIKTRSGGTDIDGTRLLGTCRRIGYTYAEFSINGTSRGNNVLALADATDLNNQTAQGTIAAWDQFTNDTEGFNPIDVNADSATEDYYSEWNIGGGSDPVTPNINDLFEWTKDLTRDGSVATVYGISGELFRGITHSFDYDNELLGPFTEPEEISWTGGVGQLLAIDDNGVTGTIWMQLLSGAAPTDGLEVTGATSSATCDVDTTITSRSVSKPFIGVSTGSALIGAYGVGVVAADLTQFDSLTPLTGTAVSPPNIPVFTVAGLVASEDQVLVFPWDGVSTDSDGNPAIEVDQLALSGTLDSSGQVAIVVATAIPVDTPTSGTVRVELDDGNYRLVAYTSWTGSTFTTASTDWTDPLDATTANNAYISYIDGPAVGPSMAFSGVYDADRDLGILVRDGKGTPIKQFISSGTFGSSSSTITAIRTSDT